jgi:hypothetical protein
MNNLSIQIVRIGHKLNEINMSFAAKIAVSQADALLAELEESK